MFSGYTIKDMLAICRDRNWHLRPEEMAYLCNDPRPGVVRLCERARREQERHRAEQADEERMLKQEVLLWSQGYTRILGLDEVGRGPIAGPVCVGGVVFAPNSVTPSGIRDSKTLSQSVRERLAVEIRDSALVAAVACRSSSYVDAYGIVAAIRDCQWELVELIAPDFVLLDGNEDLPGGPAQLSIVRGDSKSVSIAAASILAKVHRDRIMLDSDTEYPQYGFAANKGYGTPDHLRAVRENGPSPLHRRTFLP